MTSRDFIAIHPPGVSAQFTAFLHTAVATNYSLPRKIFRAEVSTLLTPPLFNSMRLSRRTAALAQSLVRGGGVLVRITVAAALMCLSLVGITSASDVQAAIRQPTNIAAQALAPALATLAKDRNVQLVYRSELLENRRTGGAAGDLTFEEALAQLLAGTGLTYRYLDDDAITIVPSASLSSGSGGSSFSTSAISTSSGDGRGGRGASEAPGQGSQEGSSRDTEQRPFWSRLRLAQRSSLNPGSSAGSAPGASSRSDKDPNSPVMLEEVLVTAQKRVESEQSVPISMSTMSGAQLVQMGAQSLVDYAAYIPGLQVDNAGGPGQSSITLRGISTGAVLSSTVGTYIDDAPLGSSGSFAQAGAQQLDLNPYDLERIEVLRGPQGTLYGASTLGGLLKYVTRSPDPTQASARIGVESFAISEAGRPGWTVRSIVNEPLIADKLAIRASYFRQQTPGYIDNGITGRKGENTVLEQGGRVSVLWRPISALSLKLAALVQQIRSDDDANVALQYVQSPVSGGVQIGPPVFGDLHSAHQLRQPFDQHLKFVDLTADWDANWATLTAVTSYSRTETISGLDFTPEFGSFIPLLTNGATTGVVSLRTPIGLTKYTQELRLASPSDMTLEWLIGGFFTDERASDRQELSAHALNGASLTVPTINPFTGEPVLGSDGSPVLLDPVVINVLDSTYREAAVFGDLTYRVTGKWDVGAGFRWARNRQSYSQTSTGVLSVVLGINSSPDNRSSEGVATYMATSRYHLSKSSMIYGRIATGYRPGGPNFALPGIPPSVRSDRLTSYELGIKSQSRDGRMLLDVAAYRLNWKDIQLDIPLGALDYRANGSTAQSRGVELTTAYSPVVGLQLALNAAYTHAFLTTDTPSLGGVAGDQLPNTPKWSGSVTADYTIALAADWMAHFGGGARYVGNRGTGVASSPDSIQLPAYSVLDVTAGVDNSRWTLRLYAKNITDKRAYLSASSSFDSLTGTPFQIDATVLQPRTVGLAADYTF